MRGFTFQGPGKAELTELPDPEAGSGRDPAQGRGEHGLRHRPADHARGEEQGRPPRRRARPRGERHDRRARRRRRGLQVGQLCGVSPIFACGVCRYCQNGLQNLCEHALVVGYDVDGGLGEWMVIPEVGVRAGRLVPAPRRAPARAALAGRAAGLLPQRPRPVPRRRRRRRRHPRCRPDRAVPPAARRDRRRPHGDRLRPVARHGGRWPPSWVRASPSTRRARTSPRSSPTPRAGSARRSPSSASAARSWSTTP